MARLTRHEKPLSKTKDHGSNPNGITVNQHVIPCAHILEWSIDKKTVEVFDLENQEFKTLSPDSPYFCVMRLWDQWTESKMLKSNEDNFQSQIKILRRGGGLSHFEYVMAYYVLLCVRVWVANKERPHYASRFSSISHECNKAELEQNELEMDGPCHIVKTTIDPGSQHDARQVVQMAMNKAFIRWCDKIKNNSWLVFRTDGEDFILSDAFCKNYLSGFHVLPIDPGHAIIAESTYKHLEKTNSLSAQYINGVMKNNAVNYFIRTPGSDNADG